MEKPHRFAQLYGYAVCLVAVIVALISGNSTIQAIFDLSDPAHASWGGRVVPATFEEYRAEQRQSIQRDDGPAREAIASNREQLSDEELRRIYDAKKSDALAIQTFQARRSLASSLLLLLGSIGLFLWHWRWLRTLRDETPAATT